MNHRLKLALTVSAIVVTAILSTRWAWNTLAELFGGPEAEVRHIVALFLLLGIVRLTAAGRHFRPWRHELE